MDSKDWENLGNTINRIQNTVQDAVDSQNFQQLNQSITVMVNKTISQYQASMPKRAEQARMAAKRQELANIYGQTGGYQTGNILKIVFGSIGGFGFGTSSFAISLVHAISGYGSFATGSILAGFTAVCAGIIYSGCRGLSRISRFKKYKKALGTKTYCSFEELARAVAKPVRFVQKDVTYMIDRGWFTEGHLDQQQTLLITTNETYSQYQIAQKQMEDQRKALEEEKKASEKLSPQVREVLDKGYAYLDQIHKCNDAIPGVEISDKISQMEKIVAQIFQYAKEHPEVVPELKRMMDYYLPTTIKLLQAYEEMDRQPIQSEKINSSKREIEQTLDTLNDAFTKLLDTIFQEKVWDVSSDISVLNTMLAQEGLTESAFKK
jgi:5-bromo-4-chloroindolyl phosphate hydrolysis protein